MASATGHVYLHLPDDLHSAGVAAWEKALKAKSKVGRSVRRRKWTRTAVEIQAAAAAPLQDRALSEIRVVDQRDGDALRESRRLSAESIFSTMSSMNDMHTLQQSRAAAGAHAGDDATCGVASAERRERERREEERRRVRVLGTCRECVNPLPGRDLNQPAPPAGADDWRARLVIPWEQVLSVEVITPTVLSIVLEVHRFIPRTPPPAPAPAPAPAATFRSPTFKRVIATSGGAATATAASALAAAGASGAVAGGMYRAAEIELFVCGCPARKLHGLIQERMGFAHIRNEVRLAPPRRSAPPRASRRFALNLH